MSRSFRRPTPP